MLFSSHTFHLFELLANGLRQAKRAAHVHTTHTCAQNTALTGRGANGGNAMA
jgi:hypothetical protein